MNMEAVQANILGGIIAERLRQDRLHPEFPECMRMAILVEEVGEVAKALQEGNRANLIEELQQVSAVAIRWIEHLEGERT